MYMCKLHIYFKTLQLDQMLPSEFSTIKEFMFCYLFIKHHGKLLMGDAGFG